MIFCEIYTKVSEIDILRKYLFGVIVTTYVLSAVGIPVYLHYCGGELEKVNYVIKGNSCCGGEEDASSASDDCCRDENLVLQNTPDFTLKQLHQYSLIKTYCNLFFTPLPFSSVLIQTGRLPSEPFQAASPPGIQQRLEISTSVLRI